MFQLDIFMTQFTYLFKNKFKIIEYKLNRLKL